MSHVSIPILLLVHVFACSLKVAEIEDGETVLGGTPIPPATAGGETPEASVMPVADVMVGTAKAHERTEI